MDVVDNAEPKEEVSMSAKELRERLDYLRRNLLTLEWDKKHNQLNRGMESRFEELKKEYTELKGRLPEGASAEGEPEGTSDEPETTDFFGEREAEPEAAPEEEDDSPAEEEFDFMKEVSEEPSAETAAGEGGARDASESGGKKAKK